jgi:succinate dehydrogenase flavin-adding protein (antitoxin of CptAB toxin-antitoxin module)
MKYLSFDVGIKNLAYCVINTTTQSSTNEKHNMFEIADWQIINLVANKIKPNKLSCSHNVTTKRKCGVMT